MKPIVLRAFGAIMVSLAFVGGAAARSPEPILRCRIPAGAQLVAQDPVARIVVFDQHRRTSDGTDVTREWRYCLRTSGDFHTLVIEGSYAEGSGNLVAVEQVKLSGLWAAWSTITVPNGGRAVGGDAPKNGAVTVRDLPNAETKTAPVAGYDTCGFGTLVLNRAGIAAWEVARCRSSPVVFAWAIQALDGRTAKSSTLDAAPNSTTDLNPYQHLRLRTCSTGCKQRKKTTVQWQSDGVWHTAAAP